MWGLVAQSPQCGPRVISAWLLLLTPADFQLIRAETSLNFSCSPVRLQAPGCSGVTRSLGMNWRSCKCIRVTLLWSQISVCTDPFLWTCSKFHVCQSSELSVLCKISHSLSLDGLNYLLLDSEGATLCVQLGSMWQVAHLSVELFFQWRYHHQVSAKAARNSKVTIVKQKVIHNKILNFYKHSETCFFWEWLAYIVGGLTRCGGQCSRVPFCTGGRWETEG